LSEETKELVGTLAIDFLQKARFLGLSYEDLSNVRLIPDLLISSLPSDNLRWANLLDAYNNFILNDMVEGQQPISIQSSSFRSTAYSIDGSNGIPLISTPSTFFEKSFGLSPQMTSLPNSSGVSYKVSLMESQLILPNPNYLSLPLSLNFDRHPCSREKNTDCSLSLTLRQIRDPQKSEWPQQNFSLVCNPNEFFNESFECPS